MTRLQAVRWHGYGNNSELRLSLLATFFQHVEALGIGNGPTVRDTHACHAPTADLYVAALSVGHLTDSHPGIGSTESIGTMVRCRYKGKKSVSEWKAVAATDGALRTSATGSHNAEQIVKEVIQSSCKDQAPL
ncbi:hypothetical protein B0G77_5683 [Paraburkholderia sp. BL10I2N1]|nr:hypothetical protein B0G77_5683 [Paraburkholderia sp. BL10I2N1]